MVPLGRALAFIVFYMLYLLLGGYMFNAIECPEELAKKNLRHRQPHMDSRGSHTLSGTRGHGSDGREWSEWSLYTSVFFAFTSITTIGYGRTAPQTQLGRAVLLVYTFIGIPINGILIGTIGAFFSIKVSDWMDSAARTFFLSRHYELP